MLQLSMPSVWPSFNRHAVSLCLSQSVFQPLLHRLSMAAVAVMVVMMVLYGCPARAASVQPWGVHLATPAPEAVLPSPPSVQLRRQRFQDSDARLEAERQRLGPYAAELGAVLLESAREAEEYGDPERALGLYQQALFSTRVNEGLYAAGQIPILESMLSILRNQGDPQAIADRLDYYYHLMGQGARPYSDERLEASVRWLRVNTELLAPNEFRGRESKIIAVWEHAEGLTNAVCEDPSWSGRWCTTLTLQSLALLYLIDYRIDPLVTEQYGAGLTQSSARSMAAYGREWDMPPTEQRLYSIERMAVGKGRELLDRARAIDPGDMQLRLAEADFEWLLGRRSTALEAYRSLKAGNPDWFQQPEPLPVLPAITRDPRLAEERGLVAATLRVTEYGIPRDIVVTDGVTDDIETSDEDADGEGDGGNTDEDVNKNNDIDSDSVNDRTNYSEKAWAGFARRQLRELKFRPALNAEGEVVDREWTSTIMVLR